MKKIATVLIVAALLLGTVGSVAVGAYGTGVEVISREITMIKTGLYGQKISFSDQDFKCALCITDFEGLIITSLPGSESGTLLLDGERVSEGQYIKRKRLEVLSFLPSGEGVSEASFQFRIDQDSGIGETRCLMKFIGRVNKAPVTEDSVSVSGMLTTGEGISLFSRLNATDPEGDEIEYIVVKYPKNGSLSFVDKSNGRYKYTPVSGYVGYDEFVYVVRDCYGNYSEPKEVEVKVTERMSDVVYRDMTARPEYNAAVALSALGIMDGRIIGDGKYFMPEEAVSRAEFVAMAMKAYGIRPEEGISEVFFDDAEKIPASLSGYVARAAKMGIIDGNLKDGQLIFRPSDTVTFYEAAEIIAGIMGIEETSEINAYPYVPVYLRGKVGALIDMGIIDEDADISGAMTKADVAEMLYRMIIA